MADLFHLSDTARVLAADVNACRDLDCRQASPCLPAEARRELTLGERSGGGTARSLAQFAPKRLCDRCRAKWHLELGAQILDRLEAEAATLERLNPTERPNAKEGT